MSESGAADSGYALVKNALTARIDDPLEAKRRATAWASWDFCSCRECDGKGTAVAQTGPAPSASSEYRTKKSGQKVRLIPIFSAFPLGAFFLTSETRGNAGDIWESALFDPHARERIGDTNRFHMTG